MGNFADAHRFTAEWEGGYSDHPNDPGGVTNYGISLRFLAQTGLDVGDVDGDGDIDADDIKALTPADAARIMRAHFWTPLGLDDIPNATATAIYDTAVNMGIVTARKLAQKALGVVADGIWGPITMRAFERCDDRSTAEEIIKLRKERYAAIIVANKSLAVFSRGWSNRCDALLRKIETC